MLSYTTPPLALEVLEIGNPHFEANLGFSTETLISALGSGLANLKAVGFAEAFLTEQRILEDEEIEAALWERQRDRLGHGHDHDQGGDEDVGVYYL